MPAAKLSMSSFDVLSVVGEGSYGVVLKCRCKRTGDIVAVKRFKEISSKEAGTEEYVKRIMLRELHVLQLLRGEPNVVQLIDAFRDKGQMCLVMHYVENNLLDFLQRYPNGLPLPELQHLLFTLLIGVRSCHRRGILHRDIKPENTLVRPGLTALLCDFGTSRTIHRPGEDSSTGGGMLRSPRWVPPPLTAYVATRWYRSPEMLLGVPHYGFASDMWAVGAMMAELAVGAPLLPGRSEMDQLALIRQRVGDFPRGPAWRVAPPAREGRRDGLAPRFRRAVGPDGVDLLRALLAVDPTHRCTADAAIAHPFFASLRAASLRACAVQPRTLECLPDAARDASPAPPTPRPASGTRLPSIARKSAERVAKDAVMRPPSPPAKTCEVPALSGLTHLHDTNAAVRGLEGAKKTSSLRFGVTQPALKRKGRLLFTSRNSVEGL